MAETVSAGAAWTVGAAVAAGAARLAEAGCDSPRLDAELLLAEVLDSAHPGGRERIVLDRDIVLGAAQRWRYEALLERRVAREPVAYILGRRDFRYLTLTVDRRVLIPRPETELLVEVGLGLAPGLSVADVGTGSGAVALALASERPDLTVAGLDIDAGALAVAAENGRRLGLPVRFAVVDLLDEGRYDAVLANLPYVAYDAALAPEIRDYEPARALFAGADGLELIRRLVKQAQGLELLALEIGPEQARAVSSLVLAAGFGTVEVRRDLAGLERVVIGRS